MSGIQDPTHKTEYPDHGYVEERLSAYLDGQLVSGERQIVEQHLAACASCRWSLETLRQTVLWTRNLPTVPVPRSFALPVAPARQAARGKAPARRWRLVPTFQLATALVALLLFFAVAGDFALTGFQPASAPAPMMLEQAAEAPQAMETVVVEGEPAQASELSQAAPDEPEAEIAMQRTMTEGETAGQPPDPAATAAPAAGQEPTVETYALTEAEAAAATAAPPGMGGGMAPTVEETVITESLPVPAVEGDSTAQMEMMAVPEGTPTPGPMDMAPTATIEPTPLPLAAETAPETLAQAPPTEAPSAKMLPPAPETVGDSQVPTPPTAVVEVEETVEAMAAASEPLAETADDAGGAVVERQSLRGQALDGLRLLEYALGVALVLLVGTTIALMVWRRRTG